MRVKTNRGANNMFKRDTLREWLLLLTIIAFFSGCRKETGPISPDTTPPYVISVESTSEIEVEVVFNERVESATAVDLSNYTIEGFSIYDATLENDQKTVMLIVFTDYPDTMFHVITVRNVKDLSENTMDEQSLTFSGWFKGLLVQAELIRATYYWTHIEESRVSVMEDGWWDDYSTVIVDGERLFLYIEGLYRVGMTLDSGRDYLLFMETSKGSIVTGSVKMTYPVEITTPTSGDTIPENQSLQVRWQYEGSPPESLLLFL